MTSNLSLSTEELETLRLHLLVKQLENAYENVPYYENFFRENNFTPREITKISDLSRLPIITKETIRLDDTQFINRKHPREKYHSSYSSGSMGEPFRSYFDSTSWVRKKYISKFRARKKCGLRIGEKVAIFETETACKLDKKNRMLRYIRAPYHVQFFSIFDDLETTLKHVGKFNPQNCYGPPSYFFRLAQLYDQQAPELKNLKRLFTASEYLTQSVRDHIEKSFQAPVYDHYGCTETKEVAWQCKERGGYHINEDEVIVEILDGDSAVPDGEVGDIVLTDLRNRAMPFIRYRIGDKGMLLKHTCPCGLKFKLMRPLAGRSSEYISLPDGEQISPYLLTTAIENVPGLLKYQIIQKDKDQLQVKVIMGDSICSGSLLQIKENLQQATKGELEVTTEVCEKIDIEKNGKFKVVKSFNHNYY
jgi:phenylacetate-CoA ligase